MNSLLRALSFLLLFAGGLRAEIRSSADYSIVTDVTDSVGGRSSSARYSNDGSSGGVFGTANVASPQFQDTGGYIGQLGLVGFIVTNLNSSGPGSLREVISLVGAPPAPTTVTFDAPLAGRTISLGGTQIYINKDVTIDASDLPGGIIVSGDATGDGSTADDTRVFEIFDYIVVEMKGLTIVAGRTTGNGGGILNSYSDLTLTGTTLSGNTANEGGGLANNQGSVTLIDCFVINNVAQSHGGGVRNSANGALAMNRSTVSGNTSVTGGGGGILDFYSTNGVTLSNSTLSGNTAVFGAGIYSQGSTVDMTNCTVSGNSTTSSVGGGVYLQTSSADLNHTTIAANSAVSGGGGVVLSSSAVMTFSHCVIAGNTGSPGADFRYFGGTINSNGTNLIGNNETVTAAFPTGSPNVNGDLVGLAARIAPLANYGGPTQTMPPLPGSPTIEGGLILGSTPLTDQRGAPRPTGPLPDIGAVEAFPFSSLPLVDTDSDGIDDRIEPAYPQFTVGVNDSALDSDHDGFTDAEELANMTNPDNANDLLKILSFRTAAGFQNPTNPIFDVTVATFPGLNYEFEESSTLQTFQLIPGTAFTAGDFTSSFQVILAPNRGFLRAKRN